MPICPYGHLSKRKGTLTCGSRVVGGLIFSYFHNLCEWFMIYLSAMLLLRLLLLLLLLPVFSSPPRLLVLLVLLFALTPSVVLSALTSWSSTRLPRLWSSVRPLRQVCGRLRAHSVILTRSLRLWSSARSAPVHLFRAHLLYVCKFVAPFVFSAEYIYHWTFCF